MRKKKRNQIKQTQIKSKQSKNAATKSQPHQQQSHSNKTTATPATKSQQQSHSHTSNKVTVTPATKPQPQSHSHATATKPQPRHSHVARFKSPPGWVTKSSSNWSTIMRLGRSQDQSDCPTRNERGLSIGRKLKYTDLIDWANVDRIGRIGWVGSDWSPCWGFPDLPLPQPQLRVITSNEF